MRENRPWSQSELAQRLNKHQETISQWENPDYGRYSLTTLKELAKVFDVALLVKFVPLSELVKDMVNLSEKSLSPPSFSDDHPQFTMPSSWVVGWSFPINANNSFFFGLVGQAAQGKFPQTTSAREFLPPTHPRSIQLNQRSCNMREELRLRLASEYGYAVTKMKENQDVTKKLFYFSVFFGETQRVLNWEWDRDLVIIHQLTQQLHAQITATLQNPMLWQGVPIDWQIIFDKMTDVSSSIASYFGKAETERNREELLSIFGRLAEIAYAINGNGSYLIEKGIFKF